jgi:hypothetical protein
MSDDRARNLREMNLTDIQKLNTVVEFIIGQESFADTTQALKAKLDHSEEPFVWSVLNMNSLDCALPETIKSVWVFVLRRDVPSGCHYHPNSIQHMVVVEGKGLSRVGESQKRMVRFGAPEVALNDVWHVVGENVPHEFFPEETDMVVVSFHTCPSNKLEEIDCATRQIRIYERGSE